MERKKAWKERKKAWKERKKEGEKKEAKGKRERHIERKTPNKTSEDIGKSEIRLKININRLNNS